LPEIVALDIVMLAGVMIAGILGVFWLKTRTIAPKYLQSMVKDLNNSLEHQKKETRIWRGKFNQRNQTPQVMFDGDIDSPDAVGQLVKEVLPEIRNIVPREWRKYLDSPKMVDMAIELYKKNPDAGNKLLQKFIKKKGSTAKPEGSELPAGSEAIEGFDPSKAV